MPGNILLFLTRPLTLLCIIYRFRHDNILVLDLDLPERTTEDFDGNLSQRVQETVNIALLEDEEELAAISQEKMPNVYIENPESISKVSITELI